MEEYAFIDEENVNYSTTESYDSYTLKFGKYKNKTLSEIWKIDGGRKYLGYISHQDFVYDNIKNKIKKFMKSKTICIKT